MVIDSNGDYAVGVDYDEATQLFDDNIGGNGARRVIKLNVRASLPEEIEECAVDVPDDAGTTHAPTVTESTYPNG